MPTRPTELLGLAGPPFSDNQDQFPISYHFLTIRASDADKGMGRGSGRSMQMSANGVGEMRENALFFAVECDRGERFSVGGYQCGKGWRGW